MPSLAVSVQGLRQHAGSLPAARVEDLILKNSSTTRAQVVVEAVLTVRARGAGTLLRVNTIEESDEGQVVPGALRCPDVIMESDRHQVTELRLDAGGLWAIRSASATVYLLDLDAGLLMRRRGPGSPSFVFDGEWVPLVDVESPRGDHGVVRVGDRHIFLTDPEPRGDWRWAIPRACTSIDRVRRAEPTNPRHSGFGDGAGASVRPPGE